MPTSRNLENRRVALAARPIGIPQAAHFAFDTAAVPELDDGQIPVRNRYLSIDPAMRGWINAAANYASPVPVGDVMRSFAAGEVIAPASDLFRAGDLVSGMFGWQRYAVVAALAARAVAHRDLPLSTSPGRRPWMQPARMVLTSISTTPAVPSAMRMRSPCCTEEKIRVSC